MATKYLRPESIEAAVCEKFGVSVRELHGRARTRAVSMPRMLVGFLMRKRTTFSLEKTGDLLGGRDHTTVIYLCARCTAEMDRNPSWRATVEAVEKRAEEIEEENDG